MRRSRFVRRWGSIVVAVLATTLVTGLGALSPAQAATSTLNNVADPTYQTNGRVWSIVTVGGTVYIGGDFTSVRPPGAAAGTSEVPRARLAAFDSATGQLLDWNPGADKTVQTLAASPDGQTIYVGGAFGVVGGVVRKRVAAVDATTGVVTAFKANTNYKVYAIAPTSTRIYLGGSFTAVNGAPRSRLAAVGTTGAVDPSWAPSVDGPVRTIKLSGDASTVYVGGTFSTVDGQSQANLAKLSASGAIQSWTTHPNYPVWDLVVTSSAVYVGGNGSGGHAGSYSLDGVRGWVTQTDGGVQAIELFDGVLYVGGHFDNVCVGDTVGSTSGFTCTDSFATRHKLLAVDPSTGALDPWNPSANSPLGVFALYASANQLHVGGDFTRIHSRLQQGYAAFSRL